MLREEEGRGNLVLPASTMSVGGSQQGLSSLVRTERPTPTTTRPQGNPGEEEEEDDLPDFVLGVLELEVIADTLQGEANSPDSGDQVVETEVVYPPKPAGAVQGPGQPVGGATTQTTGGSSAATTSTATTTNANVNGTGRERTMPTDGLMRSFWRR
jgi:hypothetical protein